MGICAVHFDGSTELLNRTLAVRSSRTFFISYWYKSCTPPDSGATTRSQTIFRSANTNRMAAFHGLVTVSHAYDGDSVLLLVQAVNDETLLGMVDAAGDA